MEQDTGESNVLNTNQGVPEIQLGEAPNEDALMIYLSQDNRGLKEHPGRSGASRDIDGCRKHRMGRCICLSKIHYEIDGDLLCVREMRPFMHISKVSILHRRGEQQGKKDT